MFLTHDEVCELTGAKTKAGQIENLKSNSVRYTIKRSGWPSVTKAAVINPSMNLKEQAAWQSRKVGHG